MASRSHSLARSLTASSSSLDQAERDRAEHFRKLTVVSPQLLKPLEETRSDVTDAAPEALDDRFSYVSGVVPAVSLFQTQDFPPEVFPSASPRSCIAQFSFEYNPDTAAEMYKTLSAAVHAVNGFVLSVPASDQRVHVYALFPSENNLAAMASVFADPNIQVTVSRHKRFLGYAHGFPALIGLDLDGGAGEKFDPRRRGIKADASRTIHRREDPSRFDLSQIRVPPYVRSGNGAIFEINFLHIDPEKLRAEMADAVKTFSVLPVTDIQVHGTRVTVIVQRDGSETVFYDHLSDFLNRLIQSADDAERLPYSVLFVSGPIEAKSLGDSLSSPRFYTGKALADLACLREDYGDTPGVVQSADVATMLQKPRQRGRVAVDATPIEGDAFGAQRVHGVRRLDGVLETEGPLQMVGREAPFEEVQDMVDAFFKTRKHRRLFIDGPPGIGKSRFIEEIRRYVATAYPDANNFFHAHYEDKSHKQGASIFHFYQKISKVSNVSEVLSPKAFFEMARDPRRCVAYLRDLIGHSTEPVVFSLDDLQWADAASTTLFRQLFRLRPDNLLLIGADRGASDAGGAVEDRAPEKFRNEFVDETAGDRRISLTALPFDREGELLSRFVCSFFASRFADYDASAMDSHNPLPATLMTLLAEKSEGNPLCLKEFLEYLVDREIIVCVGGVITLKDRAEEDISTVTKDVLFQARINRFLDRVSEGDFSRRERFFDAFAWLHVCTDIGIHPLDFDVIPVEFDECLEQMQSHGLASIRPSLRFSHGELRNAFVGIVDEPRLRRIRIAALEKLDKFFDSDAAVSISPSVLYHLAKDSQRSDFVRKYAYAAAVEANDHFDHHEAFEIFGDYFRDFRDPQTLDRDQLFHAFDARAQFVAIATRLSKFEAGMSNSSAAHQLIHLLEAQVPDNSPEFARAQIRYHLITLDLYYAMERMAPPGILEKICDEMERNMTKKESSFSHLERATNHLLLFLHRLRAYYQAAAQSNSGDYALFDQTFEEFKTFTTKIKTGQNTPLDAIVTEVYRLAGMANFRRAVNGKSDESIVLNKGFAPDETAFLEAAEKYLLRIKQDITEGRPVYDIRGAISALGILTKIFFYSGDSARMDECFHLAHSLSAACEIPAETASLLHRKASYQYVLFQKESRSSRPVLARRLVFLESADRFASQAIDVSVQERISNQELYSRFALLNILLERCRLNPEEMNHFVRFFHHFVQILSFSNRDSNGSYSRFIIDAQMATPIARIFMDFVELAKQVSFDPVSQVQSSERIPKDAFLNLGFFTVPPTPDEGDTPFPRDTSFEDSFQSFSQENPGWFC